MNCYSEFVQFGFHGPPKIFSLKSNFVGVFLEKFHYRGQAFHFFPNHPILVDQYFMDQNFSTPKLTTLFLSIEWVVLRIYSELIRLNHRL